MNLSNKEVERANELLTGRTCPDDCDHNCLNTIFQTYSWYKKGEDFDSISEMLAYDKESLRNYYSLIDTVPELNRIFEKSQLKVTLVYKELFNGDLTSKEICVFTEILKSSNGKKSAYYKYGETSKENPNIDTLESWGRFSYIHCIMLDLEDKGYLKIEKWFGKSGVKIKSLRHFNIKLHYNNSIHVPYWPMEAGYSSKEIIYAYIEDRVKKDGKMKISDTAFLYTGDDKLNIENKIGYYYYYDIDQESLSDEELQNNSYNYYSESVCGSPTIHYCFRSFKYQVSNLLLPINPQKLIQWQKHKLQ